LDGASEAYLVGDNLPVAAYCHKIGIGLVVSKNSTETACVKFSAITLAGLALS
jgi:hypothetical protein